MAKGISIHIGVDNLDPAHYTGFPALKSCKKDAQDMAQIVPGNFEAPIILLDDAATTDAVTEAIKKAAGELNESGGILFLTYSGHGGRVKDMDATEGDGLDETWCLFNRQLLDDELFELWTMFNPNVRIIVISDSCNNGTVTGSTESEILAMLVNAASENAISLADSANTINFANVESKILNVQGHAFAKFDKKVWRKDKKILDKIGFDASDPALGEIELAEVKALPPPLLETINTNHRPDYEQIQRDVKIRLRTKLVGIKRNDIRELVDASVLLISACQDWQVTKPGAEGKNSVFTAALKEVWKDNNFNDYLEFHLQLWKRFENPPSQSDIQNPNYYRIGRPNPEFEMQKPLTI